MPARDPLELRKHAPTIPDDLNDPPRFSQLIETTQDAFVLELRHYFDTKGFHTEARQEVPTIEKYAVGFGSGLDPYETYLKIVADFPDVGERMPHIAVTTVSGQNKRMTAGRPFIAHTQAPPRVVTALPGPYALDNPVPEIVEISVASLPGVVGETYTIVVDGVPTSAAFDPGTTRAEIAAGLATVLRESTSGIGLLYVVTATPGASALVVIQRRAAGEAFVVSATSNLAVVASQAAGSAPRPAMLVFRTWPKRGGGAPITSVIQFPPSRFRTSEPLSAVPAAALVRVFNEQALFATAREVPVGVGTGVQIEIGGRLGGDMPNEIEILASSTPSLIAALGLATVGAGVLGDTIGGIAPDMTLTVAAAPFANVAIGEYVTLANVSTANQGRFLVTGRTAGVVTFMNPEGVAEAFAGTYFVGRRDDTDNPARPVMNRYHLSAQLSITIDILAESPNERREVTDLVFALFLFELELRFFTFYGRGVFDEAFPDEHYQITLHQEIQEPGEQEFPRGEDQKSKIHAMRVVVPCTTTWYVDRTVLVPYGPSAGLSWTLESVNVTPGDLPPAS